MLAGRLPRPLGKGPVVPPRQTPARMFPMRPLSGAGEPCAVRGSLAHDSSLACRSRGSCEFRMNEWIGVATPTLVARATITPF